MRIACRTIALGFVAATLIGAAGCTELEGRNGNREGNRAFREMRFVDAVAAYEEAVKKVDEPIIHYNLGLAYSKVLKPGLDGPVRLGVDGDPACKSIPNTKLVDGQVCVKKGDRSFIDCDEKDVCPSSFTCEKVKLCTLTGGEIADNAATHWQKWLAANEKDDDTRKQMTGVWLDAEQYPKAIAYWEDRLKAAPDSPEVMGNLAGINLKAGDWRKSIEWYQQVAAKSADPGAKVAALGFIGNVAWSKLNSKTLDTAESIELADKGIGALQQAAAIEPKAPKLYGLQASIYNFRSLQQGASWAAAIDRANAQDLQKVSRVLNEQAKQQAGGAAASPTTPSTPPTASGSAAGSGAGSAAGSAVKGS